MHRKPHYHTDTLLGDHELATVDSYNHTKNASLIASITHTPDGQGVLVHTYQLSIGSTASPAIGGADIIEGGLGDDLVLAGGGDDQVDGGDGADVVFGEGGRDLIQGGIGNTQGVFLFGEAGDDLVVGNDGADYLDGGSGKDQLFGHAGNDVLDGGTEEDTLAGGDGQDILLGGDQNDELYGEQQDDVLIGGGGNDVLWGDSPNALLAAWDGNDYLDGGDGILRDLTNLPVKAQQQPAPPTASPPSPSPSGSHCAASHSSRRARPSRYTSDANPIRTPAFPATSPTPRVVRAARGRFVFPVQGVCPRPHWKWMQLVNRQSINSVNGQCDLPSGHAMKYGRYKTGG